MNRFIQSPVTLCPIFLGWLCLLWLSACQPLAPDQTANLRLKWHIKAAEYANSSETNQAIELINQIAVPTAGGDQASSLAGKQLEIRLEKSADEMARFSLALDGSQPFSQTFYAPTLAAMCMEPSTASPVFFINSRDEGNGVVYHHLVALNQHQQWQSAMLPGNEEETDMAQYITCQPGQQRDWQAGQHAMVQPCDCAFEYDVFAPSEQQQWLSLLPTNLDSSHPLPADFKEAKSHVLTLQLIEQQDKVQHLITTALEDERYQISRFEAGQHVFINLVLEQGIYQNLGITLLRVNQLWYVWTLAGDSSKGFHPIHSITSPGNGLLNMQMCISDCDWWGNMATVELDLNKLRVRYMGPATE